MTNWTDEIVVFYQEDGHNDRLQKLHLILHRLLYANNLVDVTSPTTGMGVRIERALMEWRDKWKQDYPGTDHWLLNTSTNWVGAILPAMDLHHWYQKHGRNVTNVSFIQAARESGVVSVKEPGKRPFVRIHLKTEEHVLDELLDQIAAHFDLKYVQKAISENGRYAFNTDIHHEFIPLRHQIRYYNNLGELMRDLVTNEVEELLDVINFYEGIHPIQDMIPDTMAEHIGNFSRSPKWQESIEKSIPVMIEKMNQYLTKKYMDIEQRPTFVYKRLDETRTPATN